MRFADHPLVPNGVPHKNRKEVMLAATIIRQWHVALRFCREDKKLSLHQLADRVGVSAGELVRWESGNGCPSGSQLPRLYSSLPKLQAFKEYLPKLAVKTATMVEVAQARAHRPVIEAAARPVPPPPVPTPPPKPAPTPAPPPVEAAPPPARSPSPVSFGAAVRAARSARGWDQRKAAQMLEISQSTLSKVENDGATIPHIYMALVDGLPELRNPGTPVPTMVRRRSGEPWPIPTLPAAPPPPAPPVAPAPAPVAEQKALAPLPAGESLAVRYAAALDAAALAAIEADQAQKLYVELDDKAKAAKGQAEDLLRQLQERAGWKG